MKIQWTKDQLRDTRGYPLTQALFLEVMYSDYAIFTMSDEDKEYNGKTMYSLRKLYLEIGDPTEYQFAKTCLLGWDHWQRMLENKRIREEVDKWRAELEVSLLSEGVHSIVESAANGNFQSAKWLAERSWKEKRGAGRPSKQDADREKRIASRVNGQFDADIIRLEKWEKAN